MVGIQMPNGATSAVLARSGVGSVRDVASFTCSCRPFYHGPQRNVTCSAWPTIVRPCLMNPPAAHNTARSVSIGCSWSSLCSSPFESTIEVNSQSALHHSPLAEHDLRCIFRVHFLHRHAPAGDHCSAPGIRGQGEAAIAPSCEGP